MTTLLRGISGGGSEEGQLRAPSNGDDDADEHGDGDAVTVAASLDEKVEKAAGTELSRAVTPASVEVPAAKNMPQSVRIGCAAVE